MSTKKYFGPKNSTFFFSEMCNSGLGSGVQYSGCRDNKWGKFFKIALIRTKPGLHEITYSIIVF